MSKILIQIFNVLSAIEKDLHIIASNTEALKVQKSSGDYSFKDTQK